MNEFSMIKKTKVCKSCFTPKALDKFSRDRQAKDGHASYCNECKRTRYERIEKRCIKEAIRNGHRKREGIIKAKRIWKNLLEQRLAKKASYKNALINMISKKNKKTKKDKPSNLKLVWTPFGWIRKKVKPTETYPDVHHKNKEYQLKRLNEMANQKHI